MIITVCCIIHIWRPLNTQRKYSRDLLSLSNSKRALRNGFEGEYPPFLLTEAEGKCIIEKATKSCAEILQNLAQHMARWNGMSLWGNVDPQREILSCYLVKIAFSLKTSGCCIHPPSLSRRDKTVTAFLSVPSARVHKNKSSLRSQIKGGLFTKSIR